VFERKDVRHHGIAILNKPVRQAAQHIPQPRKVHQKMYASTHILYDLCKWSRKALAIKILEVFAVCITLKGELVL
jgi:hypothetical protein